MAASQVVSIRLRSDQVERLRKFARRFGKSQSQMGAELIEESMRETEFDKIEFKDTAIGRQAFMKGTRLKVWGLIMVGRGYKHDRAAIARHFEKPVEWVDAAYKYYAAFPDEIDCAIESNDVGYERLKQILPNIHLTEVNTD